MKLFSYTKRCVMSRHIILKTNGQLLFVLIDNWCYKIIIVPGPRTKCFDVTNLVLPYMKLQVLDELFSCPIIYQYPETLSLFSQPHNGSIFPPKISTDCSHTAAAWCIQSMAMSTAGSGVRSWVKGGRVRLWGGRVCLSGRCAVVWGGRRKRSLDGGFRSVNGCPPNLLTRIYLIFWFGIHKLARQLHQERTQMEA